jgi:hypothetical protein
VLEVYRFEGHLTRESGAAGGSGVLRFRAGMAWGREAVTCLWAKNRGDVSAVFDFKLPFRYCHRPINSIETSLLL